MNSFSRKNVSPSLSLLFPAHEFFGWLRAFAQQGETFPEKGRPELGTAIPPDEHARAMPHKKLSRRQAAPGTAPAGKHLYRPGRARLPRRFRRTGPLAQQAPSPRIRRLVSGFRLSSCTEYASISRIQKRFRISSYYRRGCRQSESQKTSFEYIRIQK